MTKSNNGKGPTTAKVQWWQKSNDGKSPMMAKSNNGEIQQQQGLTMTRSNNSKSPTTVKSNNGSRAWSLLTPKSVNERRVVNTKVHHWETPSLPRRQRKDQWQGWGGCQRQQREEGNKGNKGEGNKGKCHLVTCWKKKCTLTWVVIYFKLSSLSPTFIITLSSSLHCLWHPPQPCHCSSFIFWVDLVSPSSELWCSPPPLSFTDFGISGLQTLLPLLDFAVGGLLLSLNLAVVGLLPSFACHSICNPWTQG